MKKSKKKTFRVKTAEGKTVLVTEWTMPRKKSKKKINRCVYCKKLIEWGAVCNDCGYQEDKNLEKDK